MYATKVTFTKPKITSRRRDILNWFRENTRKNPRFGKDTNRRTLVRAYLQSANGKGLSEISATHTFDIMERQGYFRVDKRSGYRKDYAINYFHPAFQNWTEFLEGASEEDQAYIRRVVEIAEGHDKDVEDVEIDGNGVVVSKPKEEPEEEAEESEEEPEEPEEKPEEPEEEAEECVEPAVAPEPQLVPEPIPEPIPEPTPVQLTIPKDAKGNKTVSLNITINFE